MDFFTLLIQGIGAACCGIVMLVAWVLGAHYYASFPCRQKIDTRKTM